jgi:tripeptide aminopeptidase
MKEVNIKPLIKPIRGGTDGCQLSYKGCLVQIFLPADFHGKYEYVPVESMQKQLTLL